MDMDNLDDLFMENCFLPCIGEAEVKPDRVQRVVQRKDLDTLLAELNQIENNIEEIRARQWHLAELAKFHREGIVRQ